MLRNTFFAVLAVLAVAASSQAGVILSDDGGVATPGLAGFKTFTVTATSDVAGETITGVDFFGSATEQRGFFGTMNQVPLFGGALSTIFQDNNVVMDAQPGLNHAMDSQFLFKSANDAAAVNSPTGFSSENGTSLRALFSRDSGFGQATPLVQLVIPDAAAGTVNYNGTFSVLRGGVNVTIPEITGSIGGVVVVNPPVIVPVNLGEIEGSLGVILANLDATGDPTITWSNLTPVAGSPVLAATLAADGKFSWDPAGSLAGPKGSGNVLYSWNATASNGGGPTTGLAISLILIPEPATMSLLGLAMVSLFGFFGRKRS